MVEIRREALQLSTLEAQSLQRAIAQQLPEFGPRVTAGGLETELIIQPWFARHRVIEVMAKAHFPAQAVHVAFNEAGQCGVLTGNQVVFNAMVTADPPPRISSAEEATVYANLADHWTTESGLGELLLASFDDIPWHDGLHEVDEVLIEDLAEQVGELIGPPRLIAQGPRGYALEKWILAAAQLLHRVLHVGIGGSFERKDQLIDGELPVPRGSVWGMVDGRLVPTG